MENINMNANSKVQPLTIEALRIYKKQNPNKFFHKFGDLDLDNLPEGFTVDDANRIRFLRTQELPKPKLMTELQIQNMDFAKPKEELTLDEVAAFLEAKGLKVISAKEETKEKVKEEAPIIRDDSNIGQEVTTNVKGGEILESNKQQ